MSLRLRLILAFFFLSVVPLGALTAYVHTSNARAMRETAGRETELLTGELSQRMQVVTARLTEQVEHLVELAESNEAATETARRAVERSVTSKAAEVTEAADDAVASSLGQLAMLLNNVELRDSARGRGAGGGRGGRGQGRRGDGPPPAPATPGAPNYSLLPGPAAPAPPPPPAAPPPPGTPRTDAGISARAGGSATTETSQAGTSLSSQTIEARGRGDARIGPTPGSSSGRGPNPMSLMPNP